MFEELVRVLRQQSNDRVLLEARTHGHYRWQQSYKLDEVLYEFGHLHIILLEYIGEFIEQLHDVTPAIETEVRKCIHKFFNDASIASAQQYTQEQEMVVNQYREKLENANKELLKANRAKDEFLAIVSHELRTPLTVMVGWVRLLHTSKLDEATREYALETIERNIKAQDRLINDLLDIGRIITGKLHFDMQPLNLLWVIQASIEAVCPAAEAKNIKIDPRLDQTDTIITGDSQRLQQVVLNLLTNAIKFTPDGGQIKIELVYTNSNAVIKVSDTGKGIKPNFLPYVFDRFWQAEDIHIKNPIGLGIGLMIVRHIVEFHGGTVQAESPGEGQGASFTVTLPTSSYTILQ